MSSHGSDKANTDNQPAQQDRACCIDPKPLVYKTMRKQFWTTRYRRCVNCGECSKTVQVGNFVDGRKWDKFP